MSPLGNTSVNITYRGISTAYKGNRRKKKAVCPTTAKDALSFFVIDNMASLICAETGLAN